MRHPDGDANMHGTGSGQGFWDLLTSDERRVLVTLGRDKRYPPGATLCIQGDPATHVFILVDGWVKVVSVTDDGRESVLALRGGGDIAGETASETSGRRNATMQAIDTVHALIVGYDSFSSFLDAHPGASHVYRRLMTQRWSDTDAMLRNRAVTSGAQRLAGLFLDLAERHGSAANGAVEVALPLSQEELASLAGASRATVTRALSNWRKRGFIRTGQRRITIVDLRALRRAAGPAHLPFPREVPLDWLPGGSPWPEAFALVPPSPYKGLRAFEWADRDLFFGRASVVQELARAVATRALVPVVGASGVGKSSVVNAGLLPQLENQEAGWGFVTVRPRPTLALALAAGLARLSGSSMPVPVADLETWQERLTQLGLASAAGLACASSGRERVLVTVDQFEEVLTQDCDQILRQLADLPDDGMLTVVLTLREDSFGAFFVRDAGFGERLRQSAVALRGMDRSELAVAVRAPAELHSVQIAPPLVEKLVEAILDRPGALPLLEFSLDQMWRTLRPGQHLLSSRAYEEIGGLDGALAGHADRVLGGLPETEQAVVRNLFVNRLTSPAQPDVRQVLRRSECTPGDWQIIVRLADERLLTIGSDDNGHETAEVVHEALLGAWGRLRGWLDAERPFRSWRQLLGDAMTSWTQTTDRGSLLTGTLLAASERWLDERAADLSLTERRFIEMSLTRRAEEEHRYQVLYQRSLARTLSHAAEAAQDPVLALLLAVEVIERSPDAQADRLVRACLNRLGAAEIGVMLGETGLAASHRFRRRMTLADWSRGPDSSGRWVLGDPAAGLVVDQRGRVLYGADGVIPMPCPVVMAACTRAGVACLVTEDGQRLSGRSRIAPKKSAAVISAYP